MPDRRSSLGLWLRRYSLALVAALGGAAGVAYAAARDTSPPPIAPVGSTAAAAAPRVAELPRDTVQDALQIAILLDTSSSMDGLINQARSHLWKLVDDMGRMTRVVNGKQRSVRVELALYEYGNSSLSAGTGYIRQVLPLTSDLDRVSEQLQRLYTNGGEEYPGQAIQTAVTQLQWSSDPDALRFVFVAGNEPFDQGSVAPKLAIAAAKAKDIHVQLIHCGSSDATWTQGALLAQTDLTNIDQNQVAQHIAAPQDAQIMQAGTELNATYMAYGAEGAAAQERQVNADASSVKLSKKVAIERAQLKGKASYRNEAWDVVDAVSKDAGFLATTPDGQLPAELRGKPLEEKQRIVGERAAARAQLKAKIANLENERNAYVAAERSKLAKPEGPSLETEIAKPARKAATAKGYKP